MELDLRRVQSQQRGIADNHTTIPSHTITHTTTHHSSPTPQAGESNQAACVKHWELRYDGDQDGDVGCRSNGDSGGLLEGETVRVAKEARVAVEMAEVMAVDRVCWASLAGVSIAG